MNRIAVSNWILGGSILVSLLIVWSPIAAQSTASPSMSKMMQGHKMGHQMMARGLVMPVMNAANGRKLFATKGCVACHSVHGIGGTDAAPLDASTMKPMMNPFDFSAQMWAGAEAMIKMQSEELGGQIQFTGQELGDIIAFTHDPSEQRKFSEADIPPQIRKLLEHHDEKEEQGGANKMDMKPGK